MIRIAICDDDKMELQYISRLITEYSDANKETKITVNCFANMEQLLNAVSFRGKFDLYLLDIMMDGPNGIEAAKEIKIRQKAAKVVFLTNYPEYAVQSYMVKPCDYILKPIEKARLYSTLDEVIGQITAEKEKSIVIRKSREVTTVSVSELEFVEVYGRHVEFNLANGTTVQVMGRLKEIEAELAGFKEFLKPHRSYLVNMDFIVSIDAKAMHMKSGKMILMPQRSYNKIKEQYLEYMFEN